MLPFLKTRDKGQLTERLAAEFLKKQGIIIIDQNYTCRGGEIDLIGNDNSTYLFIEVRFRKHLQYGSPLESVDGKKQKKIITAATHYLQKHRLTDRVNCRFDVIGLTLKRTSTQPSTAIGDYQIDWVKQAFDLS